MSQLTLSYPDLWSFYRQSSPETRQNILEQLDLDSWMSTCTVSVRKEIMAEAPVEVAQRYVPAKRVSSQLGFLLGKK